MSVQMELRVNAANAPAISRAGWNRLFNSAIKHAKTTPEYPADSPVPGPDGLPKNLFEVHVLLTDDAEIETLNVQYLRHKGPTDVLAFEQGAIDPETGRYIIGQIIVSVETARKQAAARVIDFEEEIRRYALHGWLHLLGYADKTPEDREAMTAVQEQLLKDDHRVVTESDASK